MWVAPITIHVAGSYQHKRQRSSQRYQGSNATSLNSNGTFPLCRQAVHGVTSAAEPAHPRHDRTPYPHTRPFTLTLVSGTGAKVGPEEKERATRYRHISGGVVILIKGLLSVYALSNTTGVVYCGKNKAFMYASFRVAQGILVRFSGVNGIC